MENVVHFKEDEGRKPSGSWWRYYIDVEGSVVFWKRDSIGQEAMVLQILGYGENKSQTLISRQTET